MSTVSVEKQKFMEKIKNYQLSELSKFVSGEIEPDYCDMVELYHGTTLKYLNNILENGLLGRKNTGISNYDKEGVPSNKDLVYLSNKWHFTYALTANDKSLVKTFGEDYVGNEELIKLWEDAQDVPIIISVLVPKNCLVIDEDIVFNRKTMSELRNGELELENIPIDRALEIGTVATFYPLKAVDINSIYFIGNEDVYRNIIDGWYSEQVSGFFSGFETSVDDYNVYSLLNSNGVTELEFNDFVEIFSDIDGKNKVKLKKIEKIEFNEERIDVILEKEETVIML